MAEEHSSPALSFPSPGRLPKHPFFRWLYGVRHVLFAVGSLVLFMTALWVLHRELAHVHLSEVLEQFRAVSRGQIGLALLFTAVSYLSMTGYDALALRYIGRRLPYPRIAMISFTAVAVGQNVGMAMISSGMVRLRMYTAAGLTAAEVAIIVGMCTLTFGIGVTFVGGVALAFAPAEAATLIKLSNTEARLVGVLILLVLVIYLTWGILRREPLQIGGWRIPLPAPEVTFHQILLAGIDLCGAAAVLYTLLPGDLGVSYPHFLSIFLIAIVVGIASHVPAGAGVFETVLLLALPDAPRDMLLGAILAYRLVYYLLPLALAAMLAGAHEMHVYRAAIRRGVAVTGDSLTQIAPQIIGVAVFLAGTLLLASGATPVTAAHRAILHQYIPLSILELAHLFSSLSGVGLLILARELYLRVREAYRLSLWLLLIGILACLVKGLDYEESLVLALILGGLWLGRAAFDHPGSLLQQPFSAGWAAAVTLALMGTLWVGLFSFKYVDYSGDLWSLVSYEQDAARFMRAMLVSVVAVIGFSLAHLLRKEAPLPGLPDPEALERAWGVIRRGETTRGHLALSGDKRLLFNEAGDAFLMYQVRGRSWIALGDPLGPADRAMGLIWHFNELCEGKGGRATFYEVDERSLPQYRDLGLAPLEIGEEALVSLVDGAYCQGLRPGFDDDWEGLSFEVVEPPHTRVLMPQLREISDTWLSQRWRREKGFMQGSFEPAYLTRGPCALIRMGGEVLGFANLWTTPERTELAADLIRYRPVAPPSLLDYLFRNLCAWGAAEGYRTLNLGLAPLPDLDTHPLAPMWRQIGTLIFRHGEHFHSLREVRAFKERFQPQWRPKYVAAARGLGLPNVLLDVAALVDGGARGPTKA